MSMVEKLKELMRVRANLNNQAVGEPPTTPHDWMAWEESCADFLRDHGQALVEAVDRQHRLVPKAQAIVLDIWQTWYGGAPEWTPGDNMSDLLNQIVNGLWGLPEFAKAMDARVSATNVINLARTKASAGGGV